MRYRLSLTAAVLLSGCSPFSQNERKGCGESHTYAGRAIHGGIDRSSFLLNDSEIKGELDTVITARLDSVLQWILDTTHATGASVAVGLPGKGVWARQTGLASVQPDSKVDSNTRFHAASIGKIFTAAAVMRLIEKDSLKYGDRLSRWFPDFKDAGSITIHQLLTHTSGIANFNEDSGFNEAGYRPPAELLAIAKSKNNYFCPGQDWYYSNTGYVLLALILEKIQSKPFHAILIEDVIGVAGLKETSALAPEIIPPQVAVPVVNGQPNSTFNQSLPFGAGNVISTAKDLVLFLNGYLTGKIVKQESVAGAAETLFPMFDNGTYYGRGLMVFEFEDAQGNLNRWMGHSGGSPGEKAVVAFDLKRRAFASVIFNCDVSAEAAALRLLAVLDGAAR